jgi:hypothetical protein|tara:strand:- start:455 stop:631 length:177 start_codon:yes stop_codon:yes gene_type:complete
VLLLVTEQVATAAAVHFPQHHKQLMHLLRDLLAAAFGGFLTYDAFHQAVLLTPLRISQ